MEPSGLASGKPKDKLREAIQAASAWRERLLRFARNDADDVNTSRAYPPNSGVPGTKASNAAQNWLRYWSCSMRISCRAPATIKWEPARR